MDREEAERKVSISNIPYSLVKLTPRCTPNLKQNIIYSNLRKHLLQLICSKLIILNCLNNHFKILTIFILLPWLSLLRMDLILYVSFFIRNSLITSSVLEYSTEMFIEIADLDNLRNYNPKKRTAFYAMYWYTHLLLQTGYHI